jgi:hypothetical protein
VFISVFGTLAEFGLVTVDEISHFSFSGAFLLQPS